MIVCLQRNRRDVSPSSDVADELNRNLALGPHILQGNHSVLAKDGPRTRLDYVTLHVRSRKAPTHVYVEVH